MKTHHEMRKVQLAAPGDAPVATETLWARALGDGLYQLDNTPWHARGCALGDVVRCREEPDRLPEFVEVVMASGNLTVRVFVQAGPNRTAVKDALFEFLRSHGCHYEGTGPDKGLIAITIPKESDSAAVLDYLQNLETNGSADWESANF
jgi:hypothetical protein